MMISTSHEPLIGTMVQPHFGKILIMITKLFIISDRTGIKTALIWDEFDYLAVVAMRWVTHILVNGRTGPTTQHNGW